MAEERNYVIYSAEGPADDPTVMVFVRSYKRALDGAGMEGGYTPELKEAKKWSSRKVAERLAEDLYRCHVTTLKKAAAMLEKLAKEKNSHEGLPSDSNHRRTPRGG